MFEGKMECSKCHGDGGDYWIKFSFERGFYLCNLCDPDYIYCNPINHHALAHKRRLWSRQVSEARIKEIKDRRLSPEDGKTVIHRSTGKEANRRA